MTVFHAARRRGPRSRDHYYWLTAYLAAHGLQTGTCRLIASVIFGLGTLPVVTLILSSSSPTSWRVRLLAASVTACCAAMSSLWLRSKWPSRTLSQLCVVLGTVGIAVASLIEPEPTLGLLGATAFTVLSAYSALFHSSRLLAFTWTIGLVTVAVLALRLGAANRAVALSAVVLVVLVNVFVAFSSRILIRLLDDDINTDIEPLTGLLDHDAFYDRVATLIGARNRDDDRHLVILVVNIDSFSLLTAIDGDSGGSRARVALGRCLRNTLRREAILAHVGEAEFLVAELFTTADPSVLTERIHNAVRGVGPRLTVSIGAVSTPLGPLADKPPHDVCSELLTVATAAMFDARRAGGNRSCQVLNPPLTVLDQSDDDYPEAKGG